jgi:hypothetical protein
VAVLQEVEEVAALQEVEEAADSAAPATLSEGRAVQVKTRLHWRPVAAVVGSPEDPA